MSSRFAGVCRCLAISVGVLVLAGCTGEQAALNPAGAQAWRISKLWGLYIWICAVVYALTLTVIIGGVALRRRRNSGDPEHPTTSPDPRRDRRYGIVVAAAVAVAAVLLFVMMFADFFSGRAIASLSGDTSAITIRVTGHQWWWEALYDDAVTSNTFTTANELHIPVGRTIRFELRSADVIHSFWVPRLHGKKDMIPGHNTATYLKADKPGVYFGQCAEFCGFQHAQMRLVVVAQPWEEYEAWRTAAIRPAPEPVFENQKRGRDVFLASSCVLCHTIAGTPAGGRIGPNLTHVASRKLLASNSIPNMPGHLAGWIIDPQRVKPGVRMPQNNLASEDLRALLEYLEMLK
jgi:cytochrome c oxidase subunit 2